MKNLMTTKNLIYLGVGLVGAYVIYKAVTRPKTSGTAESNFNDFTGNCTCSNGFKGYCTSSCATCCSKLGGAVK
jgi:hypothetical protein